MERKIHFQDNSGDKRYFTIIPNYIANHSTANDQALYFQMKRYAGESGECFASKAKLMKQLGIGRKALNKSIQYLKDHKWIALVGIKAIMTKGGIQNIDVYSINDIWSMNNNFYDGGAKRTPPNPRGRPEVLKGGAERASKKNNYQEELFDVEKIKSIKEEISKMYGKHR
jgi:hypothetical protein